MYTCQDLYLENSPFHKGDQTEAKIQKVIDRVEIHKLQMSYNELHKRIGIRTYRKYSSMGIIKVRRR